MDWNRLETPLQVAHALWSFEAIELSPTDFRALFDRAYRKTNDLETLWRLGGAINDFLRHSPGVLTVPQQLPWRLLQSEDVEARVIGLKLLNRIDISDAARIDEFIRAIERHDGYESDGGLYELGQFLERRERIGKRIPGPSAERVRRSLEEYPERDGENYRGWIARLVELTEEIRT
jgi:hypothetical protein